MMRLKRLTFFLRNERKRDDVIDVDKWGRIRRYSTCDTHVFYPICNEAVATIKKQSHVFFQHPPSADSSSQLKSMSLILKQRRCELQMSARKLAGMAGCHYRTILRYESGESPLDSGDGAKYLAKVVPILGINLRELDEYLSYSNVELRGMLVKYLKENRVHVAAFAMEVGATKVIIEDCMRHGARLPRFIWEFLRKKDREH